MSNPTIDLFETRTMLRVMEQAKPPMTFLRDTFFNQIEQSEAKNVDIDIWKGKRRTAFYVNPLAEGKVVARLGYKTNTYTPPYIKEKIPTRAVDFLKRQPGETVYGSNDGPMQRAAKQVGLDLAFMDDMVTRAEEVQAAQILQTGIVTVTGEGFAPASIDYGMSGSHKPVLLGADKWDQATSDPMQNMRTWRRLIRQDCGMNPTDVIMGSSAYDAFLSNPEVKDHFNKWWMSFGIISPTPDDKGVTHVGFIKELGMNFWAYDEWYIDNADSTEKQMISSGSIVIVVRGARAGRHYAAIQDLKANFAVPRFPKSWEEEDPSIRWVMLQSAPLLAFHQVDALFCATVV